MNLIAHIPNVMEGKPDECPACGATRQCQPYEKTPSLLRCAGCGTLSRNPRVIDSILMTNIDAFNGMPQGWWETMYDRWNAQEKGNILPSRHAPVKALEVGPGRGGFIAYLQRNGYQVEGIDISSGIGSDIEKRFGVKMICGVLEDYPENVQYELVSAHHVVEHLQNLPVFLAKCRTLLSKEGNLLVSCPNVGSWAAVFRSWSGYESYHSLFFTAESMSKALERNGFTIEKFRVRQPFTGWWNILFRRITDGMRQGTMRNHGPKKYGGRARFLFNLVRIVGSAFLFPLSIITSMASKGKEIVVLAVKRNIPDTNKGCIQKI